jgi:predicted pyridoxine 5'-phosphate oxidase superfamily flavin-nucleotide-binding protein
MTPPKVSSPKPPRVEKMTPGMMQLIREQRLGFVATVNADGTPNLSPKGTFVVVDADTVAFGEIRSPGTLRNLAERPKVEVNFVDPFTRRGCRLFGVAQAVQKGEPGYDNLLPLFADHGGLVLRMRAVILIAVTRALPLASPAYDDDASEDELRRAWTNRFRALQPAGRFMS